MTAEEVYEKYKHLDANLSDRELVPESFWGSIIMDLWVAVKDAVSNKVAQKEPKQTGIQFNSWSEFSVTAPDGIAPKVHEE